MNVTVIVVPFVCHVTALVGILYQHKVDVTFRWCECTEAPRDLPLVDAETVLLAQFVSEVDRNVAEYKRRIAQLFAPLGSAFAGEADTLFASFADLTKTWCRCRLA